jgi:hypothetical protein
MNIAARIRRYTDRGFLQQTAIVNVLIEEALQILFVHFSDTFVFFGGSSLVLFYGSQRHSGDLDLLVSAEHPPTANQIRDVLQKPLAETAKLVEVTDLAIEAVRSSGEFTRILVKSSQELLFTIDLTKISATISSEIKNVSLGNVTDNPVLIALPSRNLQLLFKAEAFLSRKALKVRDAFDIKLLLDSGAELDQHLKAHLWDGPAAERIDTPEFIDERIEQINRKRCQSELQPYLPKKLYEELDQADFKPLRVAVTRLFAEWLER